MSRDSASTLNSLPVGEKYWVIAFERRTGSNFDLFALVTRDGDADNARSIPVMQDYDDGLDHREPRIAFDNCWPNRPITLRRPS